MRPHHIQSKSLSLTMATGHCRIWWPFLSCAHHQVLSPCSLRITTWASLQLPKPSRQHCSHFKVSILTVPSARKEKVLPSTICVTNFLTSFKSCFKCRHPSEGDFHSLLRFTTRSPQLPLPWHSWPSLLWHFGYIPVTISVGDYLGFVKA